MKTIFITGASSGFGAAIARRFAQAGHRLILCGRRKQRLQALQKDCTRQWKTISNILTFDVRNRSQVDEAIRQLPSAWQPVDVLINNAGLALGLDPIDEGRVEQWDQMIDTNIKGLLYVTHAVLPLMKRSDSPYVFNIGSTAAKYVYEKGNVYCATKAAVDALSQAMRIDLLKKGVRVTAIHPGMARTEFSLVRFQGNRQRADSVYEGLQPLMAEDIAEIVYWCFSLPRHVCINELIVTPTAQANSYYVHRMK